MKKKILAIGLVVCMLVVAIGSATMAYFTDTETANNVMTVGKIDIVQHETDADGNPFEDGQHLLPDVTIEKVVTIENTGNSDAYFRTFVAFEGNKNFVDTYLAENIDKHDDLKQYGEIQIGASTYTLYIYTPSEKLAAGDKSAEILTSFTLSKDATQEDVAFAGKEYNVWVVTEAVQADGFADAETALTAAFGQLGAQADGEYIGYHPFADTSWYNTTDTMFTLTDRADLLGFAALVNGGNTFEGKTVKLGADIDLSDIEWEPIGVYDEHPFAGTFDGDGKIISNMTVNGTDYVGLFGYVKKDGSDHATVTNVNVDHATISGTHYAGGIVAYGYADVTNCGVTNSTITLSTELVDGEPDNGDKAGGIIGYVGESGAYQITNNKVFNVEITGYRDLGGIAGYANSDVVVSGNTVEDITINVNYDNNYNNYIFAAEFDAEAIVGDGTAGDNTQKDPVIINVPDAVVSNAAQLQKAIDDAASAGIKITLLPGKYEGQIYMKSNRTLIGTEGAVADCINLNGAKNVTLKNIEFDAAGAQQVVDGKGNAKHYANIFGASGSNAAGAKIGARDVLIEGCTFTGNYANGGDAIAFADQSRTTGPSGNITIKDCVFKTTGAYYNVYTFYSGDGAFNIEGCEFDSDVRGCAIYLGRYQSNTPVVVKDNSFNVATFEEAAAIQAHSGSYTVSFDASNNTFAG